MYGPGRAINKELVNKEANLTLKLKQIIQMKNNFKLGDKVRSIKTGILNGIEGNILSIDPEKSKQITAICGIYGTWSFSFDEVEPIGKQTSKTEAMPWEEPDSSDNLTVATKPSKRSYKKKSKEQPIREKRKYTKRVK